MKKTGKKVVRKKVFTKLSKAGKLPRPKLAKLSKKMPELSKKQRVLRPSLSARSVNASAPGKILWIGGYSVLEKGNVSLVTAVDRRVYATASAFKQIVLSSPQYNFRVSAEFDKKSGKLSLEHEVPAAKFIAKAVEISLCYLIAKKFALKNFFLETRGDEAFGVGDGKSGLGSSAAATAASVAGVLAFHGLPSSQTLVHNLSQIAHSLAQGKVGSGFDIAAACFGSCAYSRYSPLLVSSLGASPSPQQVASLADSQWDYSVEKISLPAELRIVFANVEGTSASTTEMVKKVMEWKRTHPEKYASLIEELDNSNGSAIASLKKRDWTGFQNSFFRGREITRKLGFASGAQIEPQQLADLVDDSLRNGAFACKLPGAGGGDSIVALCLSEFGEKKLRQYWRQQSHARLNVIVLGASQQGVVSDSGTVF